MASAEIRLQRIKKILIANRGEIAMRIASSARELGMETVAIYNDVDVNSAHRFHSDYAIHLPGATLAETYLNIDFIVSCALASGCQAIHPGYGFLSENASFAQAVIDAGIIYIGAKPESIRTLGHKLDAKRILAKVGIPVVAGSLEQVSSVSEINTDTYPILLKAAMGGGGKGIRIVNTPQELSAAFAACQREAIAYFGDDSILWERLLPQPRHIEVQILADQQGKVLHLYERDCSIQRRYQKLVEEAPSIYLNPMQRQKICATAVKIAETLGYTNAGTVEFICESPDKFYFMEMNTRIQVEHPVTEMITGIDIVKEQIRIAEGEPLPYTQETIVKRGCAIEMRINCEDPFNNFTPCPGKVENLVLPHTLFTRVDTHLYQGYQVPRHFDSMLLKLICWGNNRQEALMRAKRALLELRIGGIRTTAPFHYFLLAQEKFIAGDFSTAFVHELPNICMSDTEAGAMFGILE